jgi:hypothetical protein
MIQFDLPYPPPYGNPGGWQEWKTPGTDDEEEDYLPREILAASIGIVFEMEQPDSFEVFFNTASYNWRFTQNSVIDMWEDGNLTVMWSDIDFNPRSVTEEDYAAKIGFGNWGEFDITRIYLLVDAAAMQYSLPYPPPEGNPGGWQRWFTPGTDDIDDDHMPWEVLASSVGIVFEMEQPDSFEIVYFGEFNGWNWSPATQHSISHLWEDGKLTVIWSDIDFNPRLITEEDSLAKIEIGNWNEAVITKVYLIMG